ncbi:hypothetical protein Trydic_g17723 [Trypoxylus dichotomus]
MLAVALILLLVISASINAAPSDTLIYEVLSTPVLQTRAKASEDTSAIKSSLNPVEEKQDENSPKRQKKSATTTFCVEIRPSNPYQKPYEVCESENRIYTIPIESNYKAPTSSFASSSVQSTSHSFVKPAYSAPKPAPSYTAASSAAYSTPTKTESSYPKGGHYGSYRSGEEFEEDDEFEEVGNEMGNRIEEMDDTHALRSAGYGYDNAYGYGYGYGNGGNYGAGPHGATLIKFKGAGKKKKKNKDHDDSVEHHGLVITCQPSLAGYASGIGGAIGGGSMPAHAGGYGGYGNYRSAPLEGRSSQKYRSKYYSAGSSSNDGHPGAIGGYGYGGGKHGGSKFQYGRPSFINNGGYYVPDNYNGGHTQYGNGGFSLFSSSSSSDAFNQESGYAPGALEINGNTGYSAYPISPSYIQHHTQNHFASPPQIQPTYSAPNPASSASAYHGYNPVPSISSGFPAPAAASSSSSSYRPPGTYRASENNADTSMMSMKMDTKEKELERGTTNRQEKEKSSMEGMNKMIHSRKSNMWNGNMRESADQNEDAHHQEEMKQNHQNHVGSSSKWAANENINTSTMTDNKAKP